MLPSGGNSGELQVHKRVWALTVAQGDVVELPLCLVTSMRGSASGTDGDFVHADIGFQQQSIFILHNASSPRPQTFWLSEPLEKAKNSPEVRLERPLFKKHNTVKS